MSLRWDQRNEETPDLGKQPVAPVEECGASDARRWPGCADTFNQKFRAVLGPTRFPDSSVGKESACSAGDPSSIPGSGRSAGEGIVFLGFPGGSAGKETTCNAGDLGSVPGLERSPGEGKSYPLQYSSLENSMDCIVHGVAKSWTRLSNFHFFAPTHASIFLLVDNLSQQEEHSRQKAEPERRCGSGMNLPVTRMV